MSATLYLLHGFIASGKTTYAKKLALETGAVRFTADEWVVHFFGTNPDVSDFSVCDSKTKEMIWTIAEQLLPKGVSVILDYGFWSRKDRDAYRALAQQLNVACEIHALPFDESSALPRLLKRTDELPDGELFIDENAYHVLKTKYEQLEPDENHIVVSL